MTLNTIPSYGDHMTLVEFRSCVKQGVFTDYDGFGKLATKEQMSDMRISPSTVNADYPQELTHVVWFNK